MNKQIVIFLGPPGCGKGSLSNLCVRRLGMRQLSTGNLCRQHIANGTEIGKKIDFNIKSGKLISDDLIIYMVSQWLIDNYKEKNGIILDGFPRTLSQATSLYNLLLDSLLTEIKLKIIRITVSDQCAIERITQRAICKNSDCQAVYSLQIRSKLESVRQLACDDCGSLLIQRPDDEIQTINERLNLHHRYEKELVNFYKSKDLDINELNGQQPLEDVYTQLVNILDIKAL